MRITEPCDIGNIGAFTLTLVPSPGLRSLTLPSNGVLRAKRVAAFGIPVFDHNSGLRQGIRQGIPEGEGPYVQMRGMKKPFSLREKGWDEGKGVMQLGNTQ